MTNSYSFKELFNTTFTIADKKIKLNKIVIPLIQRDYAQGRDNPDIERVRKRFLDALYEAITVKPITLDFIYGNIEEDGVLTPLDGQQRLTTLFLLYWYIAKKEKIDFEDYKFLNNFSYETRYSARDFCECLIKFEPTLNKKTISEEIINQCWFPLEWKKDPTVSSMLVMLDEIKNKFYDVNNIWDRIDNAIRFYFLPVHDMGLSDELYIKMNSRGKPLTLFENFKAELEYELKESGKIDVMEITNKIDKDWTDLLWQFRDEYCSIDNLFLRYFRFICDVICYKNDGNPLGSNLDEIELIKEYFSSKDKYLEKNVELLSSYFDCWVKVKKIPGIANFFEKFISSEHENGKIITKYQQNLFKDIIEHYGEMTGNTNKRQFPLPEFVLFYAFLDYCLNMDKIEEKDFKRRIRIVNNLIENSTYEISTRTTGNRMPSILKQVDSIIINGIINDNLDNNFNSKQLSEEKDKLLWTNQNPELANNLFKLEDHRLLYGQIYVIGLENYKLFSKFEKLFANESLYEKIGMALLTMDNYAITDNGWRYQLGSQNEGSYINLFHSQSDKVKQALCNLLLLSEEYNENFLDNIINKYIIKCEEESLYDWRYYYLKYDDFRPERFGKYSWNDINRKPYELDVMWAPLKLSERSYNPFLKAVDLNNKLSAPDYGRKIIEDNRYIKSTNSGYTVYSSDTNAVIDTISPKQNEDGIDTENRIEMMKNYIRSGK